MYEVVFSKEYSTVSLFIKTAAKFVYNLVY